MLNSRWLRSVALGGLVLAGWSNPLSAQLTIDGVVYANFRYGLVTDSSFTTPAHPNNFDVARSYLNVRSKSDGGISTRVTVDVDGRSVESGQLSFRLKYAYVGYRPKGGPLTYKFGLQPTPIIGFIEDSWGYRMQGTVAMDRTKYLSSSDFGLAIEGAWHDNAVSLDAGVYNGESYSKTPGDNRKDAAARASVRLASTDQGGKVGGLRLTGFVLYGKATGGLARERYLGMLSYVSKKVRLGAEVATTKDDALKGRVMSLWGTYRLTGKPIELIARVDRWDPDTDRDAVGFDLAVGEQTRLIAGASYQLTPMVRLLGDVDIVSVENGPASNPFRASNRSLFFHTEIKF